MIIRPPPPHTHTRTYTHELRNSEVHWALKEGNK